MPLVWFWYAFSSAEFWINAHLAPSDSLFEKKLASSAANLFLPLKQQPSESRLHLIRATFWYFQMDPMCISFYPAATSRPRGEAKSLRPRVNSYVQCAGACSRTSGRVGHTWPCTMAGPRARCAIRRSAVFPSWGRILQNTKAKRCAQSVMWPSAPPKA